MGILFSYPFPVMVIIALIRSEFTGKRRGEVGAVTCFPLGLPAILVTLGLPRNLSEKRLTRLLGKCATVLEANRVRLVLTRGDFEYGDRIFDMGFSRPDCRELMRAKAGPILALSAKGRERALIASVRADNDAVRAFRELAGEFRHITLDMPFSEAERLSDRLKYLGLTAEPMPRSRTVEADAAVFLTAPQRPVFLPSRCVYLSPDGHGGGILGGREVTHVSFRIPGVASPNIPEGFDGSALLSLALASGRLSPEDVAVI